MPRSSRPQTYGPEYEQLLLQASHSPDGYSLTLPSPSQAQALKSKIYAHWRALRSDGSRPDLIAISDTLSLRVEDSTITLFPKEDSWDAQLLRGAMGLEKGFAEVGGANVAVPQSGQKSMVEALHELRKNNSR